MRNVQNANPVEPSTGREGLCHHETADHYRGLVARLSDRWRVIVCKGNLQWVLQKRDASRAGRARWTGVQYFLTREALLRASRAACGRIDPAALAALAALPEKFGGVA
ncbi:hypothetical protein C8J27_103258 [Rhodobacter aestuarii]|uniref:Uncharacterized protein n=1 Tax=Rhodobacter aestuarii TaxID=453582 RepID=A0A1N7JZ37_9RHOB|nr:hypothetical protein [Rhodobacter aestuarii]PTV95928.1 hypothetical protein C8J27_103258 [Rhodobacter aestuarii]SIS54597.1 hypothetical protein SAMN05421580_102176 [Rhodobacter aestuarii]